jgi:hypothetical protein
MRCLALVVVLAARMAGAAVDLGYPGAFSLLRPGMTQPRAVNTTYELDVEKVLKVQALVPRRDGESYGVRAYAGSMTLGTPDGSWSYLLPEAGRKTDVAWPEPFAARVTQHFEQGPWRGSVSVDMAQQYPTLWFTLRREAGEAPLRGALLGWGWAKAPGPANWKEPRARPFLGTFKFADGCNGLLRMEPPPAKVDVDADGVQWAYPADVAEARVAYTVVPRARSIEDGVTLLFPGLLPDAVASPPQGWTQRFGGDDAAPWVEFAARDAKWLALPSSLYSPPPEDKPQPGVLSFDAVQGPQDLVAGPVHRVPLPVPPGLGTVAPPWRALDGAPLARIQSVVSQILDHQAADGTFPFNEGRSFYEGLTLAGLSEVGPLLAEPLKSRLNAAVAKGLEHAWSHQQAPKLWPGVLVMPEQPGYVESATDYPEILGCVLQATSLHTALADPGWPAAHRAQIDAQFDQLRGFMGADGIALAQPGPVYVHQIAESAIGGYLAWQALAHLATDPARRAEARARAAYAWQAWRTLYGWRAVFGEPPALINGYENGLAQTIDKPAWTFVQSTFFCFLPCFALPADDHFGLWREVDAQPWWEWSGALGSVQRVYDPSNAIALARGGRLDDVRAHWSEVVKRPYSWQSFDEAPVYEAPAAAWLATLGVTRTSD